MVGIALAWLMYGVEMCPAKLFTGNPIGAFVYRVLFHKYYLDELYGLIIKYIVLGLANGCALFDKYVIDGLVNGSRVASCAGWACLQQIGDRPAPELRRGDLWRRRWYCVIGLLRGRRVCE